MAERLLAYSDRVSAAPGESVEIKVSAPESGEYEAKLAEKGMSRDVSERPR